ncbi:MAG: MoaD/ThiS family protein [Bacillota bacterium]
MWQIKVRFFGSIAEQLGDTRVVEVEAGSRVADLLQLLGLREDDIPLCIVNGIQVGKDAPLSDGAEVMLFPVVAGG